MTQNTNRRDFMKTGAAMGAAWWIGGNTNAGADSKNTVERLNFACIGVAGKGSSDTDDAGRAGNIIALCDIDQNRLNGKANKFRDAQKFADYREMIDKLGDKIDAVTVSTPDHSHAPAAALALRNNINVFCQKPLTWSIGEARTLRELAAKNKLATQMGNQGTAHPKLRESVDIIRNGDIGNVSEVHVWTNRPIWPQGTGRPAPEPVPDNVNWDLFLGPAKERPYSSAYHPFKWRGWLDFGTGALGDMACHIMNMPVYALDLFDPTTVEVKETDGVFEGETYPKESVIEFQFPKTDKRGPVKMVWYDGGKLPPASLVFGQAKVGGRGADNGAIVVGDKGTLYSNHTYGGSYIMLPKEKYEGYKPPTPVMPRSPGHFVEFANACRGGDAAMSNFDYAGRLTETILVGNLALILGKKIEWDAKEMKATNAPEAAKLVHREYREGWKL